MRVVVEGDRVVDLALDPPLGAKVVDSADGPVLYVVNTAASLLEDDDLFVDIRVAAGGRLTVRSVAAQVAHPCLSGGSTALTVRARVAAGGTLTWWPEPLIVCAQSNHRSLVEVELADGLDSGGSMSSFSDAPVRTPPRSASRARCASPAAARLCSTMASYWTRPRRRRGVVPHCSETRVTSARSWWSARPPSVRRREWQCPNRVDHPRGRRAAGPGARCRPARRPTAAGAPHVNLPAGVLQRSHGK